MKRIQAITGNRTGSRGSSRCRESIFKTEMTIQRGQRLEQRGSIVTQVTKDSSEMELGMSEESLNRVP